MKNYILLLLVTFSYSSFSKNIYSYEPSSIHPFGLPNPLAPVEVKDFEQLIGVHSCHSVSRKQDQTWGDPIDMTWTFSYIMNGKAVQDSTLKSDGQHSGSIRLFDVEKKTWNIHYYSSSQNSKAKSLSMWTGGKKTNGIKGSKLVFYRDQKAPNGTEGYFRLSFYDMGKKEFKWVGEWTDKTETTIYPTWKIDCKRQ